MQTIKLSPDAYNAIVKTCKSFVSKPGYGGRTETDLIHLYCNRRMVRALALDGYKSMSLTVPCIYPDSDECFIAIPPTLKPVKAKDTPFAAIIEDGNKVTIETASGSQTFTVEQPRRDLMETVSKNVYAKGYPAKSVYFNPKLAAEVFSAIPTDCCRVDYYGEVNPFEVYAVTDSEMYHALLLPMRSSGSKLEGVRERNDT